jgi:hypothetical protein
MPLLRVYVFSSLSKKILSNPGISIVTFYVPSSVFQVSFLRNNIQNHFPRHSKFQLSIPDP